jgi:hypothetical protein
VGSNTRFEIALSGDKEALSIHMNGYTNTTDPINKIK